MYATHDSTTFSGAEQSAENTHRPASNLVAAWARGRRRISPWAYPHLRALGAVRLTVGLFLVVVGALLISRGHSGWAVIPLAGAVVNLAIGSLDTAAYLARHRV
jgi:hypothetical protein